MGVLRNLDLPFENPWIYLFELIQNALDAKAHSILILASDGDDSLIFQHDGSEPLEEGSVKGLSKVFQSTKGAASVGFMGIGFKSVFGCFREARISGFGWAFHYDISEVVGEDFGDRQPDMLGAVVPIWDDAIPNPEPGFTTRFELRRRINSGSSANSDLMHFLRDDDPALLAILAASGLKRLDANGRVWKLKLVEGPEGSLQATASSENDHRTWQLFHVKFKPLREAVARFLEHRKIRPTLEERDQIYADAAQSRDVTGILPLDSDGKPAPPPRGTVYATLPTETTVPFGLHINADWLLSISRSGLREIEDNPWQRGIVDTMADVLAQFLNWAASAFDDPGAVKAAFRVLAPPSAEAGGLEALLAEEDWLARLRTRIENAPVIPVWTDAAGALTFARPGESVVPPMPLARAFEDCPALRPAALPGGPVLRAGVVGDEALALFRRMDLLAEMSPRELEDAWRGGLEDWWKTLPREQENRRRLLFRLWAAIAKTTSDGEWRAAELPCVRSVTGKWLPIGKTVFLNEELPGDREPGGPILRQVLELFVPDYKLIDMESIRALRGPRQDDPGRKLVQKAWNLGRERGSLNRAQGACRRSGDILRVIDAFGS